MKIRRLRQQTHWKALLQLECARLLLLEEVNVRKMDVTGHEYCTSGMMMTPGLLVALKGRVGESSADILSHSSKSSDKPLSTSGNGVFF